MAKVLILEDEHYTRKFIKQLVCENPLVLEVYDTSKTNEAIKFAQIHQPDIVLLDIELDENEKINGLEAAKIISKISPNTEFVFITGYSKYALDSFSVHPFDYILKPIKIEKITETINLLVKKTKSKRNKSKILDKIVINNSGEIFIIPKNEILFIEVRNKETLIHTPNETYVTQKTLLEYQNQLGENFIRVHNSFLVNKNKIRKIKQIGDRTYSISFSKTNKEAIASRNKFKYLKNDLSL